MLEILAVAGYRSLREVVLPLDRLTVVTGANGSGKSNLYRAISLLASVGSDGLPRALAAEGGLTSALWAGPERISSAMRGGQVPVQGTVRSGPVSLRLGFAADPWRYAVDVGLPQSGSVFAHDAELKTETIWSGQLRRTSTVARRHRGRVVLRTDAGEVEHPDGIDPERSLLSDLGDLPDVPELRAVRTLLRSWRCYDELRTDRQAPARQMQVATRTAALAADGADLAAALVTSRAAGVDVDAALADALPEMAFAPRLEEDSGRIEVGVRQHGLLRTLTAAELSDGTMRMLLLVAALMPSRPAGLLVLNEPERSLHPDLMPGLARLLVRASQRSQVLVVTHHPLLRDLLSAHVDPVELVRDTGETRISGQRLLTTPTWAWPKR